MNGSAKIRAKTNAIRPPRAPASTPKPTSFFSMTATPYPRRASVAGEAEEVPRVVHELVNHHVVAEHGRRALVQADEVVRHQSEEQRAEQPRGRADGGDDNG